MFIKWLLSVQSDTMSWPLLENSIKFIRYVIQINGFNEELFSSTMKGQYRKKKLSPPWAFLFCHTLSGKFSSDFKWNSTVPYVKEVS